MYTLYQYVRPFGITAIVAGWDSEADLEVDAQVGSGPKTGGGGKVEGIQSGGPGLYMIEPSGLYWVRLSALNNGLRLIMCVAVGLLWRSNRERSTSSQSRA